MNEIDIVEGTHVVSLGTMECHDCGAEATHKWGDKYTCLPCVESGMAHGHKHVHDEPEDCIARLDGAMFVCGEGWVE